MTLLSAWRRLRDNLFPESRQVAQPSQVAASPVQSNTNWAATDERFEPILALLNSVAANEIPHVNGTLLPHLIGTYELLREWGNPLALCHAGLCHAVYGTQGFELQLLNLSQRERLRSVIGTQAEELVYFYASCDRNYVYPQLGTDVAVQYRDRFTQSEFVPDVVKLKLLLELTFANELELARDDSAFVECTRGSLGVMFARCQDFVSSPAFALFQAVYGDIKPDAR